MLKKTGVKHVVLNAKYHEKEAEIVAQAGRKGAVTIATNMAGRGTDILLGGNAEFMARDLLRKREHRSCSRDARSSGTKRSRRSNRKSIKSTKKLFKRGACTLSAPSGMKPDASTISCADVRDARAIPDPRGSTSRSKTI